MSKFPVEKSDEEGQVDAVNYLLSGPAGLGQNFSGKSFQAVGDVFTASPRGPFTTSLGSTSLYVAPISLSTSEMLDEVTYKFTFSTPEIVPPFNLGCPVVVSGVTDPTYDQIFSPIGVVECTTTYVIVRSDIPITVVSPSTGGTVEFNVVFSVDGIITDCQATATVTSPTDSVFLSGQIGFAFVYDCISDSTLYVAVSIFRQKIINVGSPSKPIYTTDDGVTLFNQIFDYTLSTGATGTENINAIFTSFIDQDNASGVPVTIGNYLYSLRIDFTTLDGTVHVTTVGAQTRTLTCQVVKQ